MGLAGPSTAVEGIKQPGHHLYSAGNEEAASAQFSGSTGGSKLPGPYVPTYLELIGGGNVTQSPKWGYGEARSTHFSGCMRAPELPSQVPWLRRP